MDANKSPAAELRSSRTLTVSKSGSGTVTSNPAGISCGSLCTTQNANFADGQMVTLTAAADPGHELSGWTGACSMATGTTCTVTMDAAESVGVSFVPGPDLIVSSVVCTPDPVTPGGMLACAITVQNMGTLATTAGFTTRLALSTDTTIDGTDPQLATCAFPAI